MKNKSDEVSKSSYERENRAFEVYFSDKTHTIVYYKNFIFLYFSNTIILIQILKANFQGKVVSKLYFCKPF